jgi:hypothetical protein
MRSASSRNAALPAIAAAAASFALLTWYYLKIRGAFFDDVFISLHIARNGADHRNWQYFILVDRAALLASSPLKILLLTIAAKITTVFGFTARSFANAKLMLVVYAPLAWLVWLPFWKKRIAAFCWVGTAYFLCSISLDAAVDFEGGLLFCWVATFALLLSEPDERLQELGWLIPLGFLIRPDVALPVLAAAVVLLGIRRWRRFGAALIPRSAMLVAIWCVLCWIMQVWPIPVTYWAKAALPKMVEEKFMIDVFLERLGMVTAGRLLENSAVATLTGALILISFLLATVHGSRARLAAFVTVVISGLMLVRAPSGFWWYYQNDAMMLLGVAIGLLARHRISEIISSSNLRAVAAFVMIFMATLLYGKSFSDGPIQWSLDAAYRGYVYRYLGTKAIGDGRYDLAGIGPVYIKNPELGLTSYFSGDKAWIWDSGGLAQPLLDPHVQNSPLRYFFPPPLRWPALTDAKTLAARYGKPLHIVDVWAMDDRNFVAARKECLYVIEEGAVCSNEFMNPAISQSAR